MKKLATIVLMFVMSVGAAFAQRGKAFTPSADDLHQFCVTYLAAFAPGTGDTYKDRKELIQSTRCFNYVSAVMDESSGAHWDTSVSTDAPVVRRWEWMGSATEVIRMFVNWVEQHPDHGTDPANIAIKEAAVSRKLYVSEE